MLDLNTIIKLLHDRKATVIAREANLSYQTVWRLATGKAKDANFSTLKKLSDYFQKTRI